MEPENALARAPDGGTSAEFGGALEIRCPSCRKAVATPLPVPDDLACPRCRCHLAILAALRSDADAFLREAREALRHGGHARALSAASTSWDLRHSRAAATLAFLAATLGGDALEGVAWLRASRLPNLP